MRTAFLVVALACAAAAQVLPGDFLISDGAFPTRLIAVQPGTSMVTPIAGFTGGFAAEAMMARNNRDYIVAFAGNPSAILHVSTTGQVSTIFSGSPLGACHGLCLEQVDGYVIANTSITGVYRARTSGQLDTLYTGSPMLKSRAVDTDIDTGDIFSIDANSNLYRVNAGGGIAVAATGLSPPDNAALASDWRSGDVFVGIAANIFKVNPVTGIVATVWPGTAPISYVTGIRVDDADGSLIVCSATNNPGLASGVFRMSRSGAILATLARLPTNSPTGMDVVGSRPLSGNGDARPGNTYFLDLDVPTAGGLSYVMAASLGVRPGIPLPDGRTIPLNIDPILLLSLSTPAIFQNFQSVLDPSGHATANVNIPAILALTGVRLYFAGVVIDPSSPSGIRVVSNPWGVTIR